MIPKILISATSLIKAQNYIEAVESAGAKAAAMYAPALDLSYDGLLLCGGGDVHPEYYNEKINGSDNIDTVRDKAELALVEAYVAAGKPVFGICRGFQLINVALGGSLIQDISPENAQIHTALQADKIHETTAKKQSIVYNLFGKRFVTNSAHHQAVKDLGSGLYATGWEVKSGIIESFEHQSLPVFGVQWHPERMCGKNLRSDSVDALPIFKHFINLCK